MDKVAGDDDLQPLDSYDIPGESSGNGASGVVSDADLAEATDLEG
jgi:hypothetical protein